MYQNFSGVLSEPELKVVQSIFKKIVGEPWFSPDPERHQQFAAFVIKAYQAGITEPGKLHDTCYRTAQERFAAPAASEQSQSPEG